MFNIYVIIENGYDILGFNQKGYDKNGIDKYGISKKQKKENTIESFRENYDWRD